MNDALFQKMTEAFSGDTATWQSITEGLRDIMVDYSRRRCPYYRRVSDGIGCFEDLPILTKSVIRENFEEMFAEGVPEERRVRKSTSGSSGNPLVFFKDLSVGQIEVAAELYLRVMHRVPFEATRVWIAAKKPLRASVLGGSRWSPRSMATVVRQNLGLNGAGTHFVSAMQLTPSRLKHELAFWPRLRPYYIYGWTSSIEWIADYIQHNNYRLDDPPVCVIATADTMTEPAMNRISRAFRCPVYAWYGSNEFSGYLAGTLPGTLSYAFNPLLSYVEVVDESDKPVAPGEAGRLVITDLNNYVFPLIRYDPEDSARLSREPYIGGFKIVDQLLGRQSESIILPGGQMVSGIMVGNKLLGVNDFSPWIRFYQCAQVGENELELRVIWRKEPNRQIEEEIRQALRPILEPTTMLRIKGTDTLETLPSGKRWLVRRKSS